MSSMPHSPLISTISAFHSGNTYCKTFRDMTSVPSESLWNDLHLIFDEESERDEVNARDNVGCRDVGELAQVKASTARSGP